MRAGAVFTTDNGLPAKAGASFNNKTRIAFPAQLGVYISEKSRVRLELTSMKLRSELDYGYSTLHPDPLIPSQTEVTIKAQGVHLNYDHRVAGAGKLEVFAAAGARALFASSKKEETTYGDGRSEKGGATVAGADHHDHQGDDGQCDRSLCLIIVTTNDGPIQCILIETSSDALRPHVAAMR